MWRRKKYVDFLSGSGDKMTQCGGIIGRLVIVKELDKLWLETGS